MQRLICVTCIVMIYETKPYVEVRWTEPNGTPTVVQAWQDLAQVLRAFDLAGDAPAMVTNASGSPLPFWAVTLDSGDAKCGLHVMPWAVRQ